VRTLHYSDPPALFLALDELRRQGLTPRGLLFLALDPSGEVHFAIPDEMTRVARIRVGDKLAVTPPWPGRYFHFDSIHRLAGDAVLWNGDRRLVHPGSAEGTAVSVATWLKQHGAKNVFLGCTPHRPGTWYYAGATGPPVALHASGLVDAVPAATGLLARRVAEPGLEFLPYSALARGDVLTGWQTVFESPLGPILMLERRVLGGHLVLTCEQGLIEVDITELPRVREWARAVAPLGMAIVGRIDGGAFAVTRGKVEHMGLVELEAATLVGTTGTTLVELAKSLA